MLLPFQGDKTTHSKPRAMPWASSSLAFQTVNQRADTGSLPLRFECVYLYFAIKPSARSSPSSLAFSSAWRASAFCFSSPCAMPFTMYGSA